MSVLYFFEAAGEEGFFLLETHFAVMASRRYLSAGGPLQQGGLYLLSIHTPSRHAKLRALVLAANSLELG